MVLVFSKQIKLMSMHDEVQEYAKTVMKYMYMSNWNNSPLLKKPKKLGSIFGTILMFGIFRKDILHFS